MQPHTATLLALTLLSASAYAGPFRPPFAPAAPTPISARSQHAAVADFHEGPYALFEAARRSQVRDMQPATIIRIDQHPMRSGRIEPVSPGVHVVEVSVPGTKGMSNPGRRTIVVEAQPCTRYYLGAVRSTRTSRDWNVVVDHSEPIGECLAKYR